MSNSEIWDERLSPRKQYKAPVEFVIESKTFSASSVDMSGTGIRVQCNSPLPFVVRIRMPDGTTEREAILVWANQSEDGSMNYGLQFSDEDL